jgi:Flp pilus assembly protein protease CpaA
MTLMALLITFPALMAYAAASDLLTMTIPNKLALALVVSFAIFAIWAGLSPAAIALHVAAVTQNSLPRRHYGLGSGRCWNISFWRRPLAVL